MDVLNHNFIRLGLTRAKALQTASRFPRETRRRFAAPISNALTLVIVLCISLQGIPISFMLDSDHRRFFNVSNPRG
jgi:hypothetical protein